MTAAAKQQQTDSYLPALLHFTRVTDNAKCIVVTRIRVSICGRMPTLLHGPWCNLEEWWRVPCSCALLGGSAIGAWVALLWQHSANAKCQRVLVLVLRLVCAFIHFSRFYTVPYAQIINNKWSSNFDEKPHRRVDSSLGKFNVTLDSFCGRPIGMLVDSMWENPHIRATGNSAWQCVEKIAKSSRSKVLPYGGIWTPANS